MPLKEKMENSYKARSGIALGGIGAGSMELRKDGLFYNWSIFNNEPAFSGPRCTFNPDSMLFFTVRYEPEGERPRMKMLAVDEGDHPAGIQLQFYTFPWISGMERIDYEASFPFARLTFSDCDMPFIIDMEAYSPFIPHDIKNSALPAVNFRFKLTSLSHKKVDVMLMASLRHMIGYDHDERSYNADIVRDEEHCRIDLFCDNMDEKAATWGQMSLASLSGDSTYHAGWSHRHTFHEPYLHRKTLSDIDTVDDQNVADKETGRKRAAYGCNATVACSITLDAHGQEHDHAFVLGWNFPNQYSSVTKKQKPRGADAKPRLEGHYYSRFFQYAGEVVAYMMENDDDLYRRSRAFLDWFYDSSLPGYALDQVNSHLNTFATSAWFNKDGDFGIQEGLTAEQSWGPLATIDVGMYGSVMSAYLFPELDRSMYHVHRRLQFKGGDVQHGIRRDFSAGDTEEGVKHRLDLAIQYAIMSLRHGFITNDEAYLQDMWPSIKKALLYTMTERDEDGDGLPEMDGSNCTYDNFPMFGPASYIISQWISALQYGMAAAESVGDDDMRARCADALKKARQGFEAKLWNGEFFILYNDEGGKKGDRDEGCLTDQLIGQWSNHHAGLDDVTDPARIKQALHAILQRNFVPGEGLHNCRWPGDDWLHPVNETCWYDQANTYWTGVELEFASLLIYEGMSKEGLAIVKAVDDRYRLAGRYWDHQEWGGHYYRPMSAYAVINAFLGLAIRGEEYTFAPKQGNRHLRLFFAFGQGMGHFIREAAEAEETVTIEIHTGVWTVKTLHLGLRFQSLMPMAISVAGKALPVDAYTANRKRGQFVIEFSEAQRIASGETLCLRCQ